jgi:zinc protease
LAHFFEHLMFKGTRGLAEGELDRLIEAEGGRINAATWLDWTCYEIDAPSSQFEDVVRYESERMSDLDLTNEKLESEREVVLNERRERVDDDPDGLLVEALWSAAFGDHPYGRPTLGFEEDICALDMDDCQRFYGSWYVPNQAVVVVSGDITEGRLIQAIDGAYGGMSPGDQIAPEPPLADSTSSRGERIEIELPLSAERLLMAYRIPPATDPRSQAVEVLNELLTEGDSARLIRSLITDGELASSVYGFPSMLREGGLYEIGVDLRVDHRAEEAEEVILETLEAIAGGDVSARELLRAQNKLETRAYQELQTAQQRAQSLGYWQVTADDFRWCFEINERHRAVTLDDLRGVAAGILSAENRTVVHGKIRS